MAWYWILLIVLASLIVFNFILLFTVYITNSDLKLVEKIYNALIKYHESKSVETKI